MRQITLAEFEALQQKYAEAEAGESPPQVEEHLSGIAQQLQATPNAVAYKNFTGDHIEETTLLKDGLNQTLKTNITETYAPGVTSILNETAPSINQQVTLSDSHTLNVKNRSEAVYSKNETQNINVTDWKVYHKNFTQNIPTKLTHQVTQSSQVTIDQYEGHIDVQRINADTYTHNFGTQTFNGPMQIHSSSSIAIRGKNIIFGPDTSKLTSPGIHQDKRNVIPSVYGEYEFLKIKLPTYINANCTMQGILTISGKYQAESLDSMNPFSISATRPEIQAKLSGVLQDYFSDLQITASSDAGYFHASPSLTVSNEQGNYTFSNGAMIHSISPYYAEFQYFTETSVKKKAFENWQLTLALSMTLKLSITHKDKVDYAKLAGRTLNFIDIQAPEALDSGLVTAQAFLERHIIIRLILILAPK